MSLPDHLPPPSTWIPPLAFFPNPQTQRVGIPFPFLEVLGPDPVGLGDGQRSQALFPPLPSSLSFKGAPPRLIPQLLGIRLLAPSGKMLQETQAFPTHQVVWFQEASGKEWG